MNKRKKKEPGGVALVSGVRETLYTATLAAKLRLRFPVVGSAAIRQRLSRGSKKKKKKASEKPRRGTSYMIKGTLGLVKATALSPLAISHRHVPSHTFFFFLFVPRFDRAAQWISALLRSRYLASVLISDVIYWQMAPLAHSRWRIQDGALKRDNLPLSKDINILFTWI